MKYQYHIPIGYLFLMAVFFSCTMESPIDVSVEEDESVIVLNSIFNPDQFWEVTLSRSTVVTDTLNFNIIQDADVRLFEDGALLEILQLTDNRFRTVNNKPIPGRTYEIYVEVEGVEMLTAENKMTLPVPITEITTAITRSPETANTNQEAVDIIDVGFRFTDPREANYYILEVTSESPINKNARNEVTFISEDASLAVYKTSGGIINSREDEFEGGALFDDELFNNRSKRIELRIEQQKTNAPLTYYIRLLSLTKAFFDYQVRIITQRENEDNEFAEPVVQFSNINNGTGIFAGYSFDEVEFVIKPDLNF